MKKLVSGLLAVVLLVCMSSVAFAASETIETDHGSIALNVTSKENVTFKANGETITATVYYASEGTPISFHINAGEYSGMGILANSYMKDGDDYINMAGGQWTEGMNPGLKLGQGLLSIQFPGAQGWGPEIFICSDKAKLGGKAAADNQKDEAAAATPTSNQPTHSRSTDIPYEVKMGDTLGVLALNYFGNMNYWPAIYNYNMEAIQAAPGKQIYAGMDLIIPGAIQHGDKVINVISPAAAGEGEKLYTVKEGDTYGTIALAHFGELSRYKEIFNRNRDRLQDLNTLYAGQIIVLPKK